MKSTIDGLVDPREFTRHFLELADKTPLPETRDELGTKWFERRMQELATSHGVHCQNYSSAVSGEWMKVDHVFVRTNSYLDFPLVAVEHENRGISKSSRAGDLSNGQAQGAHIEWACWKALSMRSRLSVLVAYPYGKDTDVVLRLLAKMVERCAADFGGMPRALFLLGWWPRKTGATARQLYDPYVATGGIDGAVLQHLTL